MQNSREAAAYAGQRRVARDRPYPLPTSTVLRSTENGDLRRVGPVVGVSGIHCWCRIGGNMSIQIRCEGSAVPIDRTVFTALLDNSIVSEQAPYLRALGTGEIRLGQLIDLARKADIPYALFFAPEAVVLNQLKKKRDLLLAGISKDSFTINSRSQVRLADIELIVKDLLRKQATLKSLDHNLIPNAVVGCLRGAPPSVPAAACKVQEHLGLDFHALRASRTKEKALDVLISQLERAQILVAQSQQNFMPQRLSRSARFSGLCVRDKKIPYIFLTGGDAGDNPEPAGRKIFTLTLLTVLVASGKFAAVSYDEYSPEVILNRQYELTEEILIPASDVTACDVSTLEAAKAAADAFKVTPSALVMRARRLAMLSGTEAAGYLEELVEEFRSRPKTRSNTPKLVNALRKYNGVEYSRRMINQLDKGYITQGEFCRVVCQNRIQPHQIHEFREAL